MENSKSYVERISSIEKNNITIAKNTEKTVIIDKPKGSKKIDGLDEKVGKVLEDGKIDVKEGFELIKAFATEKNKAYVKSITDITTTNIEKLQEYIGTENDGKIGNDSMKKLLTMESKLFEEISKKAVEENKTNYFTTYMKKLNISDDKIKSLKITDIDIKNFNNTCAILTTLKTELNLNLGKDNFDFLAVGEIMGLNNYFSHLSSSNSKIGVLLDGNSEKLLKMINEKDLYNPTLNLEKIAS